MANFEVVGRQDPTLTAYFAGLVDGEGCVTVEASGNTRLTIETAYPDTLQEIGDAYGAKVIKLSRMSRGGKTMYRVNFYGARLICLIQDVMPYLREKRIQCQAVLRLAAYRRLRNTARGLLSIDKSYYQRLHRRAKEQKNLNYEMTDPCENENT